MVSKKDRSGYNPFSADTADDKERLSAFDKGGVDGIVDQAMKQMANDKGVPDASDLEAPPMQKQEDGSFNYEGLPYKGKMFDYKDSDPDYMKPQLRNEANIKIFDLSNEEHLKEYQEVWERTCNGLATVAFEKTEWVEDKATWFVFVRWMNHYYAPPAALTERYKHG